MNDKITLAYGSGGRKTHRLIKQVFVKHFSNPILNRLEDSAEFPLKTRRLAFTTDSYVVDPLFFPGGDIGKLAVYGTVNDLAVKGARPVYLSATFIIREGFPLEKLETIAASMAAAAKLSGVKIVAGDTKVIEKNNKEELFITTAGVGIYQHNQKLGAERIRPGDSIFINGGLGEHEIAVLTARGQFDFKTTIQSDCAPLFHLIDRLLKSTRTIHMMRDPTRGGLATTLNEMSEACGFGLIIEEEKLTIKKEVRGVCDLLGLDPLYLANEGKVVIIGSKKNEKQILRNLKNHPLGKAAARIGSVVKEPKGVWLRTALGSLRPLIMLEGVQLPRIC